MSDKEFSADRLNGAFRALELLYPAPTFDLAAEVERANQQTLGAANVPATPEP